MVNLVERIRESIEQHRAVGDGACSCGSDGLPDHSRHVAEQLSAWFDDELTKLEGAE